VGFEVDNIILQVNGQTMDGVQGFVDPVNAISPRALITVLAMGHNTGQSGSG